MAECLGCVKIKNENKFESDTNLFFLDHTHTFSITLHALPPKMEKISNLTHCNFNKEMFGMQTLRAGGGWVSSKIPVGEVWLLSGTTQFHAEQELLLLMLLHMV